MKQTRFLVLATCVIVDLVLGFVARGNAATNVCEGSPRTVGAFGAMDQPKPPVPMAADIRSLLPEARFVRRIQQTGLGPSGEQIVMYDTSDQNSEPNGRVAIVALGTLAKAYDVSSLVEYGQGALYATSCEFELAPMHRALAIAYTLSGDGTGSAFIVLTWWAGDYHVIFHQTVGQGRIVLGSRTIELWERTLGKYASRPESDNCECEWCRHRYLSTEFQWRNGEYVKTRSKRTSKAYDPAEISGTPVLIKTVE